MTAGAFPTLDTLREEMRARGYQEGGVDVDFDSSGTVIVKASFSPPGSPPRSPYSYWDVDAIALAQGSDPFASWPKTAGGTVAPPPTAKEVARAVSHEQGMNVWKGAAVVAIIFAVIFVIGALTG